MTDLTSMYREVMGRKLVPTGRPGVAHGSTFTMVDDFQKLEQAIGNAVYTAAYALGNSTNVRKLETSIQTSVIRRFYPYVNMAARQSPRSYWHLYDGIHIGQSDYALFSFQTKKTGENRFNMGLTFKPAKIMTPLTGAQATPGSSGRTVNKAHTFYNKAMVMEYGIPTTIKPKNGGYLVFEVGSGHLVFTKKTIVINRASSPTVGSLRGVVNKFFTGGPGDAAVRRVATKYGSEATHLAGRAAKYQIDVHVASDGKARAVAATLGKMVGELDT